MERERGRAHLNYEEHVFGFVWVWVWMCGFVGWWSSEPLPVWALAKRFLKPKPAIIFVDVWVCWLVELGASARLGFGEEVSKAEACNHFSDAAKVFSDGSNTFSDA
jgi:hypothetical protein